MMARPVIAAFDFDETLITRDTLLDFMRYNTPPLKFIGKSIVLLPMLFSFVVGRITNAHAKERLLASFLGGTPDETFIVRCKKYASRLDTIANKQALRRVAWHQARGDTVVIISASPEDWIHPWAITHGITTVIATRLERKDGRVTGHLKGLNCHGSEKLSRFLQAYPERASYELYMYGDGKSDGAMFAAADKFFKRRFA